MGSSIIIRSLVVTDDTMWAKAGGGIVADSDLAHEYEESMFTLPPLLAVMDSKEAI